MSQIIIPVNGEIYTVKFKDGSVWVFKSRVRPSYTSHSGALCIHCNGNPVIFNWVTRCDGVLEHGNQGIKWLRKANKQEKDMFNNRMGES